MAFIQDSEIIRDRVARTTGMALPWPVRVAEGEGLRVTLKDESAAIIAEDASALARGYFLLTRALREGQRELDVTQRRHIASCGAMLDMSRGSVMKVEAVKRYIDQMASLGLNLLMLYTEDTYEVPEYPYFGYLRGRYSQAELRELDGYAASMGVELVPCIQTLAHLAQFLQWKDSHALQDNADILLADDEEVYRFIEAAIRAMRGVVRTNRIHIGMDEAHGVGLGRYFDKHGPADRFQLLNRHLARVTDICHRYGFEPIMWSDMFFHLGSKTHNYYDLEAEVPQHIIDTLPPVSLCYWDYYHDDESFYDRMLSAHERMTPNTVFAGGIWTWSGFLPQVKRTEATMLPALRACAKHHTQTVFATMWGDDGAETDQFLASGLLPIFSEAAWQGADVSFTEVEKACACLTGLPYDVLRAFGEFYPSAEDQRTGKGLIWCDLLYPLITWGGDSADAAIQRARGALEVLSNHGDRLECRYAALLMRVMEGKALLVRDLRERYLAKDNAYLRKAAEADIPSLLMLYEELQRCHRTLWERDMKRLGWEVLSLRYGAVMNRLRDAADALLRYADGRLPCVEELEETPLPAQRCDPHYHTLVTPSVVNGGV